MIDDNVSICLDSLLDDSGDLIKLGLEALGSKGLPPIPAYNLPTTLSMIAAAVSGKITVAGIWPSLYHCKIGRSSSGKSASSEAAYRAISSINPNFFGPSSFSSGQAFLTYMADNPHSISILDEVEWMFRGGGGKESGSYNDDDRKTILMELHTKAGVKKYPKFYADKKKSIEISTPCLNVLGSTTVLVLDRIAEADFSSGFIPRWEFFCYVGEDVQRGFSLRPDKNAKLVEFAEKICMLKEVRPRGGGSLGKYIGDFYTNALDMTAECSELMNIISRETVEDVNKTDDEYARPVLSRRFDAVLKYAMLHHVSVKYKGGAKDGHGIFDPVEIESVQWAKKLTDILASWKIEKMLNSIPAGSFHKDCELLENAIKMCEKSNRKGTIQALQNRKRAMKNWEPSYFDKVILALKNSGKIDIVFHEGKQVYVSVGNSE